MKVYRKVLVSDRLPKENGYYLTSVGLVNFKGLFNNWVEYWMEEIELPSEEEIDLEVDKESSAEESNEYNGGLDVGYHRCYEFILNKLKGE